MVKRPKKSIAKPSATHGSTAVVLSLPAARRTRNVLPIRKTQSIATQSSATATRARKQVRYASAVRTEQTPISNQTAHARPRTLTSPGTVRRMAGQLASARLYSETERMPVVNTQ
ncbi:unnamed protein product [Ceratitis capitata]|uniref:(Mediterranean fruit fly) hypothetical protein n=1 Tax=Ceratitis capitata TaxID=7213 RepID=A0A811V8H1_CERCA|nr:unnamed protein product [Ceratitis capitata]